MALDEIRIRGLRIFAHHGVFQEETRLGQTFVVNATLYTSTREGGLRDSLEDTISYADVCLFLTDFLQKNTWKLLEAAVEHACRELLLRFLLLRAVELELEKPSAPIPLPFDSVSVCAKYAGCSSMQPFHYVFRANIFILIVRERFDTSHLFSSPPMR